MEGAAGDPATDMAMSLGGVVMLFLEVKTSPVAEITASLEDEQFATMEAMPPPKIKPSAVVASTAPPEI